MNRVRPAIGVDLGTSYSCVAIFRQGKVEIIPNDQGNRTTPSCVAFTETRRLIGEAAHGQASQNPENTIFGAERLIGKKWGDFSVQSDMKHWPFMVVQDGEKPKISVQYKGEEKRFFPEEISSMVLLKMKETAEVYLGKFISDAVVTVPAHFTFCQRRAMRDAGILSGMNVSLVNAPTAAAVAYSLDMNIAEPRTVLIFDMGGGRVDVSILSCDSGVCEVQATAGDAHLGGEDFDNRMVSHFTRELKKKFKKDITENKKAVRRLRTACERAKRTLSSSSQAKIEIESLVEGVDLFTSISRARFDELNADLFRRTMEPVVRSMRDARLNKDQIDEIILVGGSTRIPQIQTFLRNFFNGKQLNKSLNPDEAMAYGAAVQAAILTGDKSEVVQDLLFLDATPLSLGFKLVTGIMEIVIKRNTTIPTKQTRTITDLMNMSKECDVLIEVYEGEHTMAKDNNFLGKFELTGVTGSATPPERAQIDVTFELDANGRLIVSAVDKMSGKESSITITGNECLSKEDIGRMAEEEDQYHQEDKLERERIEAKNTLEIYAFKMKSMMETVVRKCDEAIAWLDANELAGKDEIEHHQKDLEKVCNPIVIKHCQRCETKPGAGDMS